MIRRNRLVFALAAVFLLVSAIGYSLHYLIFRDVHHIFLYLIGDLAFLPLEVLLVTVVLERILTRRERNARLQKVNMVVGAFFSELGNHLLQSLLENFNNREEISRHLNVTSGWTKTDFQKASDYAYHLPIDVNLQSLNLNQLKDSLSERREFILTLLGNPSLLENDRFTDLLWSVTHISEELDARASLNNLPQKDMEHIAGDLRRMYDHLASEWLDYVMHLKLNYPYLLSLVLRTHPFQEDRSPLTR